MLTLLGSCLVSSGSGVLNHYAELESDRLMHRTRYRPLPTGIILEKQAIIFGLFLILLGVLILY